MMRIGLVGFGGYGWTLYQNILKVSEELDCRVVAAADSHLDKCPEKAEELADKGVELFSDALEMFEKCKGKCDVMYIATSINSHMPLAVAAAGAGYHVHLEKPPAATVQEIDAMSKAFRDANLMCMVGFQGVHLDQYRWVKDQIVSGRLGKVKTLTFVAGAPRNATYYARNNWAAKLKSNGTWVLDGPANNALAHQVNLMMFWASDKANGFATPAAIRAELYTTDPLESHNTAAIEIQTVEGPTAYFIASHASEKQFGSITIDAELGQLSMAGGEVKITFADGSEENAPQGPSCIEEMIRNFIGVVRAGDASKIRCSLDDARNMTMVIDGAHESSSRIHRIDPTFVKQVRRDNGEEFTVVEGLDEILTAAAEKQCLLSDLETAPSWTVATKAYDMSNYSEFPQQFSCS